LPTRWQMKSERFLLPNNIKNCWQRFGVRK